MRLGYWYVVLQTASRRVKDSKLILDTLIKELFHHRVSWQRQEDGDPLLGPTGAGRGGARERATAGGDRGEDAGLRVGEGRGAFAEVERGWPRSVAEEQRAGLQQGSSKMRGDLSIVNVCHFIHSLRLKPKTQNYESC